MPEESKTTSVSRKSSLSQKSDMKHSGPAKIELSKAAALVVISTAFVLPEAIQVWVSSNGVNVPTNQLAGDSETFPPGVLLASGAAEMFVILVSFAVGFGSLLFDFNDANVTLVAAVNAFVCGWFVFIVNTIASPVFNFREDNMPPVPPAGGWVNRFREEATFYMGYLVSSMAICAVALGFQFFTLLYLYRVQSGSHDKGNLLKHRCRLGYYSFLVTVLGSGMLRVAGWVRVQEGESKLPGPVVYPPNIIIYADVQLMGGLWTLLYGLLGFATTFFTHSQNTYFANLMKIYGISIFAWYMFFHVFTQVALAGPGFSGPGCQLGGLFSAVALAPAFCSQELVLSLDLSKSVMSITEKTAEKIPV
eukprot:jgi/Bigna1/85085/estExt_fgenesh1_pg.C_20135